MQNIACVARGEREGVIPRKRPRVSGARVSALFYTLCAKRKVCSLLFKSARLASRNTASQHGKKVVVLTRPRDKKEPREARLLYQSARLASRNTASQHGTAIRLFLALEARKIARSAPLPFQAKYFIHNRLRCFCIMLFHGRKNLFLCFFRQCF